MDIVEKELLQIDIEEQPPEKVVVDISQQEIAIDIIQNEKAILIGEEKKPDLLVLTTGGSLYQFAKGQGYSGTELEWMTEMLDSKASVQFVVDTVATETEARATTLLQLEAQLDDKYAKVTELNTASVDLYSALAQQKILLEAKIGDDIAASITEVNTAISTLNFAMTEQFSEYNTNFQANNTSISNLVIGLSNETSARISAINNLSVVFDNDLTGRISNVYDAIATEGSVRVTAINTLSTQLTGLIGSQIQTVTESISNEALARASQIQTLRSDFTDGLSSVITAIREVETDVEGNTSAIDSLTGTVTNPTTGLNAAFSRANAAWSYADGNAGSIATISGRLDNSTTGLTALYNLSMTVQSNAYNNTTVAVNNMYNTITAPSAAWIATNTFIQTIKSTADNAYTLSNNLSNNLTDNVNNAIAGNTLIQEIQGDIEGINLAQTTMNTSITNLNNWKTSTATVQLNTLINDVGELESRAFLGVSNTAAGKAKVAGITVSSVNYGLSFQGDVFELIDTGGTKQLYWDTATNQWIFGGSLVAASFKTATSGFRVEMDGTSAYPLWFGSGTKNDSNAKFFLDTAGNIRMFNADLQGGLTTNNTPGATRGEYKDDGTYLIWLGTGTKTDLNGTFWVKKDGTGFIKGQFFQGQIIETKYASYSSTANEAALATILNHNSAGKTIELSGAGSVRAMATGGNYSEVILEATGTLLSDGNAMGSVTVQAKGIHNADLNRTEWFLNYPVSATRSGHSAGIRTAQYQVVFQILNGSTPNFTYLSKTCSIKTFENKLE